MFELIQCYGNKTEFISQTVYFCKAMRDAQLSITNSLNLLFIYLMNNEDWNFVRTGIWWWICDCGDGNFAFTSFIG